jgi:hypothetical protein
VLEDDLGGEEDNFIRLVPLQLTSEGGEDEHQLLFGEPREELLFATEAKSGLGIYELYDLIAEVFIKRVIPGCVLVRPAGHGIIAEKGEELLLLVKR